MIFHYLAVALAKVRKAPLATAANVLTLALGLACFIAAYGIATFWSSGDAYHPDADRIVYIRQADPGPAEFGIISAAALPAALQDEMPELEAVAQIWAPETSSRADASFSVGDSAAFLRAAWADPALFDVFAFEFVEGGPDTALRAPRDIVLTAAAAQRLFGDTPALGKTVVGRLPILAPREAPAVPADYTVSAVIAPVRQPSFMGHTNEAMARFDVLANIAVQFPTPPTTWPTPAGGTTIVRLPPSMPIETFQARLDNLVSRIEEKEFPFTLEAVPIRELVAQLVDARFLPQSKAGVSTSAILLALGLLILIVACVNYANLAAAQAAGRLKETGMRRALGAGWRDLLAQQLLEAALLTLPALMLALAIVGLATPAFRTVLGVEVGYFLADPRGILVLLGVALASASAAALYPALALMRARAADALGEARIRWGFIPRLLVGVQFLSASFLLIVVSVAGQQQAYLRAVAFSGESDPVVVLDRIPGGDFDTFKAELQKASEIRAASAISVTPWIDPYGHLMSTAPPGAPPGVWRIAQIKYVGADYFETLDLAVLAGRTFDPDRDRAGLDGAGFLLDAPSAVIERRLARFLGYEEPEAAIGQAFARPDGRGDITILGVVEDDVSRLGATVVGFTVGGFFVFDPDHLQADLPVIRIDERDVSEGLAAIGRAWEALEPDIPIRARFSEDLFAEAYAPFRKIGSAFVLLSVCALAISSTGLLGIAMHVAARRRREMGIRKTLGATALGLAQLLLVDFSKPILAANLLAWPLGYFAAQTYLLPFAERVPLTPVPFVASMALTLAIAWAAVIGEVLKAASVRPAEVLRHA